MPRFTHQHRFLVPCILLASLLLNIIYVIKSKLTRSTVHPAVVHEPQPQADAAWSSQIRYNKALLTNAALPLICIFLAVGYWLTAIRKYAGKTVPKYHKGASIDDVPEHIGFFYPLQPPCPPYDVIVTINIKVALLCPLWADRPLPPDFRLA